MIALVSLLLATSLAAPPPEFDKRGKLVCPATPIMGTYRLTADAAFTKSHYHYEITLNPTATCQDVLVTVTSRGETRDGKAVAKVAPTFKGMTYVKGLRFDPRKGARADMRVTLKDGKGATRHLYLDLIFDAAKQLTGVWSFDKATWTRGLERHGTFSAKAGAGKPVPLKQLPKPSCQLRCDGRYGWGQADDNGDVHQSPSNSHNMCLQACSVKGGRPTP